MGVPLQKNDEWLLSDLPPEYVNKIKRAQFELLDYTPHEAQRQIHDSQKQFIVAVCGRRFGKSLLAAMEVISVLVNPSLHNARCWIVAPTYSLTDKVFREVWKLFLAHGFFKYAVKAQNTDQKRYIKMIWGSEVECKTADNEKSLVGEELDLLIIDEAAKIKASRVWEQHLLPTLSDRSGRALFITTPEGKNWVYDLYMKGQEAGQRDWDSFNFSSYENPHKGVRKSMVQAEGIMSKLRYQQEYKGSFISFEGAVYSLFSFTDHVIQKKPDTFTTFDAVIYGVDWGYTNPAAIIVIGIKDGAYYVIDEYYESGKLIKDIIKEMRRLQAKYGAGYVFADPSMPAYIKQMRQNKISCLAAKNDVSEGIEAVTEAMTIREYKDTERPSMYVLANCKALIKELGNYRIPEKKDGKAVSEIPIKVDDHAVDALRYAVYSYQKLAGKRISTTTIKGLH